MLDTWHHHRGDHDAAELLAIPGEAIVAIRMDDAQAAPAANIIRESMHSRLLPGEGAIDLEGIIRALDAIGCRSYIGIEVFSDELNKLPPVEAACKAGEAPRAVIARARAGRS